MKPVIITSEKATKDFANIKRRHADILVGLTNQKEKLAQLKQQKDMETQQKSQMDMEQNKQKQEAFQKNRELNIKQKALSI